MPRKFESVSKEVAKRLALHLEDKVQGIRKAYPEWPEANQTLKLPAATVFAATAKFLPSITRTVFKKGPIKAPAAFDVKWNVGDYDFSIQVDMWCRYKEQRDDLYEQFFQAMNPDFLSEQVMGLSLNLQDYHGIVCRYDIDGYSFEDEEASSQRKEWRVKIDLLSHCIAVMDVSQFAIIQTEIDSDDISTTTVVPET